MALLSSRLVQLTLQLAEVAPDGGVGGGLSWVPLPTRKVGGKPTLRLAVMRNKSCLLHNAPEFETLARSWVERTLRGDVGDLEKVTLIPCQ